MKNALQKLIRSAYYKVNLKKEILYMRSFKDDTNSFGENINNQDNISSAEELTQKILSAWTGKKSSDVLTESFKQEENSKRAGTLTNSEIDEFYSNFSPMLSGVQRIKLKSVVDRLKSL